MRPTIFWRIVLVQTLLIALILVVSLYAHSQLKGLTILSTNILAIDAACIEEAKRLLRLFLAQMRSAEKYFLLRDKQFYEAFVKSGPEFETTLEKLAVFLDTSEERAWLEHIRLLHTRYTTGFKAFIARSDGTWSREKTELSEGITTGINELIRFREHHSLLWMVCSRNPRCDQELNRFSSNVNTA